jgi:hydroxymethylpyrimidine/phosphomethylpyrimidine kinase
LTPTLVGVTSRPVPAVLSIAGSDSGGGAGIQADVRALAACGVHGMTAVTAVTAQSTVGVSVIHAVPPEMILAQVRAVADDIGVDAVKVGMLGTSDTIAAVARALEELGPEVPVVVDPVMVSESGSVLLEPDARAALAARILPLATVATPNVPEARVLAGEPAGDDALALARAVGRLGPRFVVVTGGHRPEAADLFWDGERATELGGERHPDGAAHGSGCTHSSAMAAYLALGCSPLEAAMAARRLTGEAVRRGLRAIGAGTGPVDVLGLASRRHGARARVARAGGVESATRLA